MSAIRPLVLSLALSAAACNATQGAAPAEQTAGPAAAQRPAPESITGTLAPLDFDALALWPQGYGGEFLVLEALPQGARVASGDLLVRMDTRKYEDQLRDAELALRSAQVAHAGLLERNALAGEAAAEELAKAGARLDRAQRALEAFKAREAEFTSRADELRARYEQQSIEDRLDELAQVEAMYSADELVDATEEIVLKRSRRDLETAQLSNALSSDRRSFEAEVSRPMQLEQREEEVASLAAGLQRLERSQAIDAYGRADAQLRPAVTLEQKARALEELQADAQLFTLRAARDGVLLYGKADDYRPGAKAPQVERGSRLATRSDVLLVADPARLAVTFDVSETQRAGLASGGAVQVQPLSLPGTTLTGELASEPFPAPRPAGKDGALFAARVTLEPGDHGLLVGMQARLTLEPDGAP